MKEIENLEKEAYAIEARKYEVTNANKLQGPQWMHSEAFREAAELWVRAGEMDKAEEYFLQSARLHYETATRAFTEQKDFARVVRFLTYQIDKPTGYGEDFDVTRGALWETIMDVAIHQSIKNYRKGIHLYESQEGNSYLSGDPRPGKTAALLYERKVQQLEALLFKRLETLK